MTTAKYYHNQPPCRAIIGFEWGQGMGMITDGRRQAVTGLVPPQLEETTIRVVWPSVATSPRIARLGRWIMRTIILAPLAWLMLSILYFKKILPGLACRYTLTNRRLMIQ